MEKLNVKLGKSDGQKAADKLNKLGDGYPVRVDLGTGKKTSKGYEYGKDNNLSESEWDKTRSGRAQDNYYGEADSDKLKTVVNRKQAKRVSDKAKAGKQRAKKALNMSNVSDSRLDEILAATGEQQDRKARKEGRLY